jgi:hypothetical protein
MNQNTYTPLNGGERVKVIFFIIFSIIISFFIIGIIPLLIISASIYMMRKDHSFEPIRQSRKNLKLYYKIISLVALTISSVVIYDQGINDFTKGYKYTDDYGVKKTLFKSRSVFVDYLNLIKKNDITSDSMLSIVGGDSRSNNYKVYIDLPDSDATIIRVYREWWGATDYWNKAEVKVFTEATSDFNKFNLAIDDYNNANYASTRDRVIYTLLMVVIFWLLRAAPYKLIMLTYDSLYFSQINPHSEWIAKNNIFSDRLKKKLKKKINGRGCSLADELEKLKVLLDDGAIDSDEFITAKKKILSSKD